MTKEFEASLGYKPAVQCETLSQRDRKNKLPGAMEHTSDSSAWEVEAGRSGLQGQTHLCSKFKTSLGYMKTSLKTEKKNFS